MTMNNPITTQSGMSYRIFILAIVCALAMNLCWAQFDYQEAGLKKHNELRARHGSPNLTLDSELIRVAELCAENYASNDKSPNCPHKVNGTGFTGRSVYKLYLTEGDDPIPSQEIQVAIQMWYKEAQKYEYEDPGKNIMWVMHFTQMVWKNTTKIGCGLHTDDGVTFVYCLYQPAGNVMSNNKDMYKLFKENVLPPKNT